MDRAQAAPTTLVLVYQAAESPHNRRLAEVVAIGSLREIMERTIEDAEPQVSVAGRVEVDVATFEPAGVESRD